MCGRQRSDLLTTSVTVLLVLILCAPTATLADTPAAETGTKSKIEKPKTGQSTTQTTKQGETKSTPAISPDIPSFGSGRSKPGSLSKPVGVGDLFQVLWGLLLVLGAIVAMVWLLKRLGNFSTSANKQIRIIGGVSLGTREKLVVVQVGKDQLVLGVTPGSVRNLHTLNEPLEMDTSQQAGNSLFANKLKALIQGKKHD